MASESQVRLILKKTSLEELKKNNEDLLDILDSADLNKEYGILAYLGWDDLTRDDIDTLSDSLVDLSCEEMSYRLSIIGENMDDIEEYSYTATQDEELLIPFPSITREFNEKDLENQMQFFVKDLDKNSQEEIEI